MQKKQDSEQFFASMIEAAELKASNRVKETIASLRKELRETKKALNKFKQKEKAEDRALNKRAASLSKRDKTITEREEAIAESEQELALAKKEAYRIVTDLDKILSSTITVTTAHSMLNVSERKRYDYYGRRIKTIASETLNKVRREAKKDAKPKK